MINSKPKIAVIGLAVMGKNLARNFARNGYKTAVFNRSYEKTLKLLETNEENLIGFQDLKDLISNLQKPRKIILMVKSGQGVDDILAQLGEFLEAGDIVLDCGNSYWRDTLRRQEYLKLTGGKFELLGCGISGGAEGALIGPSIMPGGQELAVKQILPYLEKVAAKDFSGKPCVSNIGLGPSGHFVKMVHNGIEYGIMQGISELYDILRSNGYSNQECYQKFEEISTSKNTSYLMEITLKILKTRDQKTGQDLIDLVDDKAGAKGTGKWTVEAALDLGVYSPTISEAVMARIASARNQNFIVNKFLTQPNHHSSTKPEVSGAVLKSCLEAVFLANYLQGLDIISAAEKEHNWKINLSEVIRVWQGGCIIRSKILEKLYEIYLNQLDFSEYIKNINSLINLNYQLRPLAVIGSIQNYFITLSSQKLPTNLVQAQRDFFGSHTYHRIDQPGIFTGGWFDSTPVEEQK